MEISEKMERELHDVDIFLRERTLLDFKKILLNYISFENLLIPILGLINEKERVQ